MKDRRGSDRADDRDGRDDRPHRPSSGNADGLELELENLALREKLERTEILLGKTNENVKKLARQIEIAQMPPGFEATYLGLGEPVSIDGGDGKPLEFQTYRVSSKGVTQVVTAASEEISDRLRTLKPGERVIISKDVGAISGVGVRDITGSVATVSTILDENHVLLRSRMDETVIATIGGDLRGGPLKPGQSVVWDEEARVALSVTDDGKERRHRTAAVADKSFADIGGLDDAKRLIRDTFDRFFLQRYDMELLRVQIPKGVLLYGPPGTGKTTLAKAMTRYLEESSGKSLLMLGEMLTAYDNHKSGRGRDPFDKVFAEVLRRPRPEDPAAYIAGFARSFGFDPEKPDTRERLERMLERERKSAFLHINGPELLDKWVGGIEEHIRELFREAREGAKDLGLAVIYIDECEGVLRRRGVGDMSSGYLDNAVAQFNAEMQGIDANENVFVVLSSNFIENIDPAVIRSGRIDMKIKVERPGKTDAGQILRKYFLPEFPYDQYGKVVSGVGARDAYVERAIDNMFQNGNEHLLMTLNYQDGSKRDIYFSDLLSGALLESIANRARYRALDRAREQGVAPALSIDDLERSIAEELKENRHLHSRNTAEEFGKYVGKNIQSVKVPRSEEELSSSFLPAR